MLLLATGNPHKVDEVQLILGDAWQVVARDPAVEETGGTLLHNLSAIRVKALPTDIPHDVEVNVSTLVSLDVAIHVSDLSLNRDLVQVVTDGATLVATVVPPRVEVEEEPVLAEGEDFEGEAAEGEAAEGEAAPAEGGEAAPAEGEGEGQSES